MKVRCKTGAVIQKTLRLSEFCNQLVIFDFRFVVGLWCLKEN